LLTRAGELGTRVWDACPVLGRWMELHSEQLRGRHVLELGSGTGLAGLVAAAVGARVVLSDQEPLMPLLRHNIELVRESFPQLDAQARVIAWGATARDSSQMETIDLVVGSDLVCTLTLSLCSTDICKTYDVDDLQLLFTTFDQLCSPQAKIVLAYENWRYAVPLFFEMCAAKFDIAVVPEDELQLSEMEKDQQCRVCIFTRKKIEYIYFHIK
jgi:predicted nicotinamide N-methyase